MWSSAVWFSLSFLGILFSIPRLVEDLLGDATWRRVVTNAAFMVLCLFGIVYSFLLFAGGWPTAASCSEIPVCRTALPVMFQ